MTAHADRRAAELARYFTAQDFAECDRVLHEHGIDSAWRLETKLLAQRKREDKLEAAKPDPRQMGLFGEAAIPTPDPAPPQTHAELDAAFEGGADLLEVLGATIGGAVRLSCSRCQAERPHVEFGQGKHQCATCGMLRGMTRLERDVRAADIERSERERDPSTRACWTPGGAGTAKGRG